jgi:hypothetical protein
MEILSLLLLFNFPFQIGSSNRHGMSQMQQIYILQICARTHIHTYLYMCNTFICNVSDLFYVVYNCPVWHMFMF